MAVLYNQFIKKILAVVVEKHYPQGTSIIISHTVYTEIIFPSHHTASVGKLTGHHRE